MWSPHSPLLTPERSSLYVVQTGLKLTILLPQPPDCWNYRCITPRPACWLTHTCPNRHLTNVLWPVAGCHTKGSSHCPRVRSPQQHRTDQLARQVKRPQPKSCIFIESLGCWVQSYCPSIAFCSTKEEHA